MNSILVGAIAVAALVVGVFFLRFWRTTGDRFFLLFALSFWIEGAHRLAIRVFATADDASPFAYLPRLVAYALIIAAIVDKNWGRRGDD